MELTEGSPIIFATGSMVKVSQIMIEKHFPGFGLYSVSRIKPFDETTFSSIAKTMSSDLIISLEEHSLYGGLGGAISEVVTAGQPKKVLRLGIEDRFSDKCGTYEYLMLEHGLDEESLVTKIKRNL
jgi:transketolase